MSNWLILSIGFLAAFLVSLFVTKPVINLALKLNIMDKPDHRKVHVKNTPRLGGVSIIIGVTVGLAILGQVYPISPYVLLGGLIIGLTGFLDDKFQLSAVSKLLGQLTAATIVIFSGVQIDFINFPYIGLVELGVFSIIVTYIWLIIIINAINLIDGLDGLAAGVSTIALICVFVMSIIQGEPVVMAMALILVGSNLGFLVHNFHPAKIYMGDTGSLFLGYCIAVLSIMGLFKNVALLSFLVPVFILAVPIFDTIFAILRRFIKKKPIMAPDRGHIHHQLLDAGYSHKSTVLILYMFSGVFGLLAIIMSNDSRLLTYVIVLFLFILIHLFAEIVGVVLGGKKPVINYIRSKNKRNKNFAKTMKH